MITFLGNYSMLPMFLTVRLYFTANRQHISLCVITQYYPNTVAHYHAVG